MAWKNRGFNSPRVHLTMKETKGKGNLTVRYKSDAPPDPDSAAMQFAREVADIGGDVVVTVESVQEDEESTTPTSNKP